MWTDVAKRDQKSLPKRARLLGTYHDCPVLDGERVVGYTSIRRQATDAAIARAEKVYARMQAGRTRGFMLHDGAIKRSGPVGWAQCLSFSSLQAKLVSMVLAVSNPRRADLDELEAQLADNRRDIESVLQEVDAGEGENAAQKALNTHLTGFLDAVDTTFTAIRDGSGFAAFEAFNDNVQPTSERISSTINQRVEQERQAAQALMASAEHQQNTLLYTQLAVLLLGIVIMAALRQARLQPPMAMSSSSLAMQQRRETAVHE